MRRRWVWDPKLGQNVEVDLTARAEQRAPMVVPDIPDYVSPVTGKLVSGRRQRRDDLARTGSRPWEGLQQERKEAVRRSAHDEQRRDAKLDESARKAYHQRLTPQQRREIEGR